MTLRNSVMADSIVDGLNSARGVMGLFGLAHYDSDNSGIKNIIAGLHRIQQIPETDLEEKVRYLKKMPTIHPEQIVFINVFKGEPLDEFGEKYRNEIRQSAADKLPLYPLDAKKMEATEFVKKVENIAKKHQQEFSMNVSKKKLGDNIIFNLSWNLVWAINLVYFSILPSLAYIFHALPLLSIYEKIYQR